ncbi:hypothetical protein [Nonomuraea sp. NPDC048826]|uniref:hypothetical protein n=1 Tax=Nonomuraea sp. NPDC048826 TaxID=3364347 RepID=UPI00371A63CC
MTLDTSPFQDDLRAEPAGPPRRASKLTLALLTGVVLVAGILTGIQAQKAFGTPAATAAAPQRPEPGQNRQGFGGRQPGGETVGTVRKVEGGTVYLKTMDGSTVTVTTGDSTTVQVTTPGSLSDLKPGAVVSVRGERGDDGAVTADTITRTGGRR